MSLRKFMSDLQRQDIQYVLSKEVIGKISDGCYQSIIRRIIFDTDTSINWYTVEKIIKEEMPELLERK